VLAGHQLPFYGLHERGASSPAHQEARCEALLQACREKPQPPGRTAAGAVHAQIDPTKMGFAFSELLAMSITCESRALRMDRAGRGLLV